MGTAVTGTTTMRAAVVDQERRVRISEVAVPEPGPGQLRIAVEGCGICGSDLPVWEGRPWFSYPREPGAPGHETWGRVDAVGEQCGKVRAGQRVAALSYHGYADYDLAEHDRVVVIPSELDDLSFPGEALGCAMNVFSRSGIEPGATVAVVGVGFLGAMLVQLASRAGAQVIGISRRASARQAAAAMGAAETFTPGEEVVAQIGELTGGRLCDVVVEAAGAQDTLDLAGSITGIRGRLVVAGYHQDGARSVDMQLWNWRGLDVINAHEREPEVYLDGMRRAVGAVREGHLDPEPLYTHRYGLDDLGRAFAEHSGRAEGFIKGLICR